MYYIFICIIYIICIKDIKYILYIYLYYIKSISYIYISMLLIIMAGTFGIVHVFDSGLP